MQDSSSIVILVVLLAAAGLAVLAVVAILALGGGVFMLRRGRGSAEPASPGSRPPSAAPRTATVPPSKPASSAPSARIPSAAPAAVAPVAVSTPKVPSVAPLDAAPRPAPQQASSPLSAPPPPVPRSFGSTVTPVVPPQKKPGLLGFFDEPGSEPGGAAIGGGEATKTELFQRGKTPSWLDPEDGEEDEGEATEIFSAHHLDGEEGYAALEEEAVHRKKP